MLGNVKRGWGGAGQTPQGEVPDLPRYTIKDSGMKIWKYGAWQKKNASYTYIHTSERLKFRV